MKRVIAATLSVGIAVIGIALTPGASQEVVAAQAAQATACDRVMALSLPNTAITGAETGRRGRVHTRRAAGVRRRPRRCASTPSCRPSAGCRRP